MTVIPDRTGDKWVPPPWHAPPIADEARGASVRRANVPGARATPSSVLEDTGRQVVLGLAIAPGATGVSALLAALIGPLSGAGSLPIGLFLICVIQVGGYVAARNVNASVMARSWLVVLATTAGLLPLLSIQASLLQEPYVSLGRGSAAPSQVATLVVLLFVVILVLWCGTVSWPIPEIASMTVLPPAILIPAVLGIQSTIGQRTALESLAESALFTSGATVLAWSLPRGGRLLVPPIAFGVQTLALWLAGRSPSFPETSGAIVMMLYVVTLLMTAALIVVLPVYAAWLQHVMLTAEEMERPRRQDDGTGNEPN